MWKNKIKSYDYSSLREVEEIREGIAYLDIKIAETNKRMQELEKIIYEDRETNKKIITFNNNMTRIEITIRDVMKLTDKIVELEKFKSETIDKINSFKPIVESITELKAKDEKIILLENNYNKMFSMFNSMLEEIIHKKIENENKNIKLSNIINFLQKTKSNSLYELHSQDLELIQYFEETLSILIKYFTSFKNNKDFTYNTKFLMETYVNKTIDLQPEMKLSFYLTDFINKLNNLIELYISTEISSS
jgi:hypothetical protein